jgi:hypothetical protein
MDIRSIVLGLAAAFALAACDGSSDGMAGPDVSLGLSANGATTTAEFVTGSAHFYDPARQAWRTFSIDGKVMPDGSVDGTFQIRVHRPGGGGAKLRGRVTCMVIEGNRAWLAGIVEKAVGQHEGKAYGFKVVDNGEGHIAAPDQFASRRFPPSADGYCAEKPDDVAQPVHDMEAGNIQVHGL